MSASAFDLRSLFPDLETAAPATPPLPEADGPEARLRLRLAVRGWIEPDKLVRAADRAELASILGRVSPDVETAVATQPGKWYLSLPARQREFARRGPAELRAAADLLCPEDEADPIRRALLLALGAPAPPLAKIETPILAALSDLAQWMGGQWTDKYDRDSIQIELANRALGADLRTMTAYPLVGSVHKQALASLKALATEPVSAGISAVYIHGGGGAGKTTLLAFLQSELSARPKPVPVVRIDFDDPSIDPNRMVTLNLALFEQLSKAIPQLHASRPDILMLLRHTAHVQSRAALSQPRGPRRKQTKSKAALLHESVTSSAASDEGSILYGALSPDILGGPVLIILDTAELVLAHSDRVAKSLEDWLDFLRREAGARDLRLIIAGRDPPPGAEVRDAAFAARSLLARLTAAGVAMREPIPLPELEPHESAELLRNCGVEDPAVVAAAAAAVPGNPLLLRITADAIGKADSDLREAVLQAHRDSRVDPESARRYLMRRVVAHVADPEARPYVLAAMYSPVVTRSLLQHAIIPAVDRGLARSGIAPAQVAAQEARRKAERVFAALSGAHWLTRPTINRSRVGFNRDLRAFLLTLLAATPEAVAHERDLRQSAAIFHLQRAGEENRALAFYHLALLGWPVRLPRDRARRRESLRDVLDELPPPVRFALEDSGDMTEAPEPPPSAAKEAAAETIAASLSDSDWQLYLEGDGRRDGEGEQLVKDDHAAEALELYISRPTRPAGLPPTFVLQAAADLGEWRTPLVDVECILREEASGWLNSKSLRPEILSRVYWLTRLALQAQMGQLSSLHLEILIQLSVFLRGPGLTMLPALISIAEAVVRAPIMTPGMRHNVSNSDAAGRVFLANPELAPRQGFSLIEQHMAVAQRDWQSRVELARGPAFSSRLSSIQMRLNGLHNRPMAEVNQLFDGLRGRLSVEPPFPEQEAAVLLLRGMTTEFHRPLREALLAVCGDGVAGPKTRAIFGPTLDAMSIRPAEMDSRIFYARLEVNPRAWCTAFVSYADRCRLLPALCKRLVRVAGDRKCEMVGQSFLAWDEALCGGGTSDWQAG